MANAKTENENPEDNGHTEAKKKFTSISELVVIQSKIRALGSFGNFPGTLKKEKTEARTDLIKEIKSLVSKLS